MKHWYRIVVQMAPGTSPLDRFPDVEVARSQDAVVLSAGLDQAGLHGLLHRIRASKAELVELRRVARPRLRRTATPAPEGRRTP